MFKTAMVVKTKKIIK